MNKVIVLLLLFSLVSRTCFSQNSPGLKTLTIPSPNTSSLGKYGEIPVSLYTGIPNISVPIHTFKSRSLELPISLTYHAGGIKVEEISSWVGLGWSLSAGGVITRSIRGIPDDIGAGYFGSRTTITTLAQKPTYLNYIGPSNDFTTQTGNALPGDLFSFDQILSQVIDAESDIFYFNFGKYSGKFFMDSNGDFVSIPIQAMKIEYQTGTVPSIPGATRWKLTMEDGVQYVFGSSLANSRNAIERNLNGAAVVPNTGWYLLEIISPANDRIDLYYTPDNYVYQSKSSEVINTPVSENLGACTLLNFDKKIVTNYFQSIKLNRISGASGDIIFNPSVTERVDLPGSYPLESIDIRDQQSAVLRKFKFSYSHFPALGNCNTGMNYCKRLRLDKVETTSPDGLTSGGEYMFGYNIQQLPSWDPNSSGQTSINSQDIWGYYNGASNDRLPKGGVITYGGGQTITIPGGLRHSAENFMQASMLTDIIYPTGGKSTFEYEANRLYTSTAALGGTNVEPRSKSAGLVLVTNDINKTSDFTVGLPYPSGPATVTVTLRQQVQNCAPSPTGIPSCYQVSVKGINGTVYNEQFLLEGTQTIQLYQGDYRITGSTIPGYEATISQAPKTYYVALNWLEQPPATESIYAESDKIVGGLRIKSITNNSNDKISVKKYLYNKFTDSNSSGVAVNLHPLSADQIIMTKIVNNVVNNCNYVQSKSTSLVPLLPTMGGVIGYANVTELNGLNGEEGKTEYTYTSSVDYPDEIKNFRPFAPSCSFDWRRGLLLKKSVYRKDVSNYTKVLEIENSYNFNNNTKTGYGLSVSLDLFGEANLASNDYYVAGYKTVSEFSYLISEKTRTYDQLTPTNFLESTRTFEYGVAPGHYQLTKVSNYDSQGQYDETITKYPLDVTLSGAPETARLNMVTKFMMNSVMEQRINRNLNFVSKTINDYKVISFAAPQVELVVLASVSQQNGTGPLENRVVVTGYDPFANPLQQSKQDDVQHSYIWDYQKVYPIAEVTNADSVDIAFTSFESGGKGRWTIPSTNRNIVNFRSGKKSYNLADGAISKTGVTLNKKYVLSFWAMTGASIIVNGGAATPTSAPAVNGWQYYEIAVTGTASITSVTISGTGTIDELRWFPFGSQMITYTMNPGIGISSIADANNMFSYYEYDTVGRLKLVKNDKGEIVKASSYYFQVR